MGKIDDRLRETSNRCIKAYEEWVDKQKDTSAREELREAIHELRKVSSRLEIEMAVSERDEMAQKPIPIPPHRASRGKRGKDNDGGGDDNAGNKNADNQKKNNNNNNGGPDVEKVKSRGKRGGGKKQASDKS